MRLSTILILVLLISCTIIDQMREDEDPWPVPKPKSISTDICEYRDEALECVYGEGRETFPMAICFPVSVDDVIVPEPGWKREPSAPPEGMIVWIGEMVWVPLDQWDQNERNGSLWKCTKDGGE